ncbi:helix-turn-helix domain-containing protein [Stenotrophomonas daejeonensis]|jgi:transcriptional regulator with XRE-family HTH domain|uniref:helix-turn-helix domain-containing protein n=1 Tax=Stenotrophomonas daejeonensis TaxID=659018 RepID=UPI0009FAAF28|nr:helix-turn-helix transcriptional regulator [Stenotrophomonas daejeonensis]
MATDSKSVQKAFGEALREVRAGRGLSQQDLALESELDRTYISLLERGLRQPTITTLIALADALDVDPTILVKRTTLLLNKSES